MERNITDKLYMKGIKNLIFDFGGVLIDLDRERCIRNFRQIGVENVESLLNVYGQQGLFREHEKGMIDDATFRQGVRDLAQLPQLTDAAIDEAWNSFLVGIPTYKLEALLELRKDYMVYLLSNTNSIHWEWSKANAFPMKSFRVEDYFEKIYLSYEMKMVKPDACIFEKVLSDAGIAAEETLFLDDSAENCAAARQLHIQTYTPKAHEDWRHLFE